MSRSKRSPNGTLSSEFIAVESSRYDEPARRVVVTLTGTSGTAHSVHLSAECLGPLVVALLSRGRDHVQAESGEDTSVRPMQLLDAAPAMFHDESMGIVVRLQPDLQLALSVTETSLAALRTAIALIDTAIEPSDQGLH